jgi:hypothetical protein
VGRVDVGKGVGEDRLQLLDTEQWHVDLGDLTELVHGQRRQYGDETD